MHNLTGSDEEISLAEELGRRVALALDNVHLYEAQQRLRADAEETAERIVRLQAVTAAFSEALTLTQVARVVVREGVRAAGAAAGVLGLLTADGTEFEQLTQGEDYASEDYAQWQRFPATGPLPFVDTVHTGAPVLIESLDAWQSRYPQLVHYHVKYDLAAFAGFPLVIDNRAIGALGFHWHAPRSFPPNNIAFLTAIAQQCAQALDRARLFEAERESRLRAEQALERIARLQAITAALGEALTPVQVADTIVQQGAKRLGPTRR